MVKVEAVNLQRCKYLDDLGLKVKEYGTNFTDTNDSRIDKWDEQRKQYGFDERETWNLDRTFIEWVYTRFTMYKEICIVNTGYHKISYKDEEITQGEAIDKVLNLSKEILQKGNSVWNKDTDKMVFENSREICEILKELLPYMWW